MSAAGELAAAVRRELAESGDPGRAAGMRAYLRNLVDEVASRRVGPILLGEHDFFIRKAIGWALREHAKTAPAWVAEFVAAREGRLSSLSRREALKHVEGVARDRIRE